MMISMSNSIYKVVKLGRALLVIVPAVLGLIIFIQAMGVEEALIYPEFTPSEKDMIDTSSSEEKMRLISKLAAAVQIPTVSVAEGNFDKEALLRMHGFLEENFPVVSKSPLVTREVVNGYSLLYKVRGSDDSLKPFMLAAHLDVVPAEEPEKWESPPFAGELVDNKYLYGRGSMDDKQSVLGIMEALEYYLKSGRQPKHTFYIAFGHDEEVGGLDGAWYIARTLEQKGVSELDFILDEGLTMTTGVINMVDRRVALVGLSEKGWMELELKVEHQPGHASMPKKESALGILARAVGRLEQSPQPSMLQGGASERMFAYLAPYVPFLYRLVLANMWLFRSVVSMAMSGSPSSNAIMRTSTAVTMFHSGVKSNVIPSVAVALVNHRVHPLQTMEEVLVHDARVMNDPRVQMRVVRFIPPSPIARDDAKALGFSVVASSINQVFPDTVVVPGVLMANTDTKWYLNFTHNVYRFCALDSKLEDIPRYHGFNERVSVDNYMQIINFYYRVIRNAELLTDGNDRILRRYTEL